MAQIISFIGQKGGVGKSALARTLAFEAAKSGLSVKLADMNLKQATSANWHQIRLSNGLEPVGSVEVIGSLKEALKHQDHFDLLILDTPGEADLATQEVAKNSDVVILPTNSGLDDLRPTIKLGMELDEKGFDDLEIAIALNLTASKGEAEKAKAFAEKKGLTVLNGNIRFMPSYRAALTNGRALTETDYPKLNQEAAILVQSIANLLT